jgi:hypothetical protein
MNQSIIHLFWFRLLIIQLFIYLFFSIIPIALHLNASVCVPGFALQTSYSSTRSVASLQFNRVVKHHVISSRRDFHPYDEAYLFMDGEKKNTV